MAPQLDYEQHNLPDIISHLNEQTMIIVQFETEASLDTCEELLAVPGIDVAMVGPADLSIFAWRARRVQPSEARRCNRNFH